MHGISTNVMFLEQSDCLGPEPMIRCYSTMETRTHPIRALPEVEGNTNHQKEKTIDFSWKFLADSGWTPMQMLPPIVALSNTTYFHCPWQFPGTRGSGRLSARSLSLFKLTRVEGSNPENGFGMSFKQISLLFSFPIKLNCIRTFRSQS